MSRPARDPGLQPERTALAWQRTVLGVVVGRSCSPPRPSVRECPSLRSSPGCSPSRPSSLPCCARPPAGSRGRSAEVVGFLARVATLVAVLGLLGTANAMARLF
ncbi:DUF202 domain-containing protein [Oerskovia sp. M15]